MALNGNILNFGADPTGVNDSAPAIQEAVNSSYPVYVPAGDYRMDSTVSISIAKTIRCETPGILTGYVGPDGEVDPDTVGEQARFLPTTNSHVFQIDAQNVKFWGGCVDMQNVSGYNKAAFYCPANANSITTPNRGLGWVIEIEKVAVIGNYSELRDQTDTDPSNIVGAMGVYMDMSNATQVNGYWTHGIFDIQGAGCDVLWYQNPRNATLNNWTNTHWVKTKAIDCRRSIFDFAGHNSYYWCDHDAGPVFPNQTVADAIGAFRIGNGFGLTSPIQCRFNDFDTGLSGDYGSYYHNTKTFDFTGANFYILDHPSEDDLDRAISLGSPGSRFGINSERYSQTGRLVLPRFTNTQLSDASHEVNTLIKPQGGMVIDSTNNRVMFANGSNATSQWLDADGANAITPV